jgi:peptide deformylase
MRRKLRNDGPEPVTRYLIRISVDRHPGDPARSNELYRQRPLEWDALHLEANSTGAPMTWEVKHDRDAFKEVWLLFENERGKFPLYPGDTTWIEYGYDVGDEQWGNWFQRAVRLPTRRLGVSLRFPAELEPGVWGMETSMTAEASPLRTAIRQQREGDEAVYTWATDDPPLHARYRLEWRFRVRETEARANAPDVQPSDRMRELGIVQEGDPILRQPATPLDLPAEAEDARRLVAQLQAAIERVKQVHTFSKGVGMAAPQIGVSRAAALVLPPDGPPIVLLNPRIVEEYQHSDEQYEGCLSFFDVRGMVRRPLAIHVEHQDVNGQRRITIFERGVARLVAHEVDHLSGRLYIDVLPSADKVVPVEHYQGSGSTWSYGS